MKPFRALARIRHLVLMGRWRLTTHAAAEAADDNLHRVDIESALLTGTLRRIERGDPRGIRYVLVGFATDRRTRVGAVVRITPAPERVIITVYEVRES